MQCVFTFLDMTSQGVAPGLPHDRTTTVVDPPKHWFQGTSVNPTGVALLRQAHARTQLQAATGAVELTLNQSHGTVSGLRTLGQNMVTEMGQGWTADISRFVLEYGSENIIPF